MGKICRAYAYSTAEDSRRPGYLKAKFDKSRRELREAEQAKKATEEAAAAEQERKVRRIAK